MNAVQISKIKYYLEKGVTSDVFASEFNISIEKADAIYKAVANGEIAGDLVVH